MDTAIPASYLTKITKTYIRQGMVVHTFNLSTQEAEAGVFSVSSRSAWSTQQVLGQ